jgi:hypothetical protein
MPQRFLAVAGQLPQQLGQLADRQAVQRGHQIGAEPLAVELVGGMGSAGIGYHPPLLGSVGSVGAADAVGLAALGSAGPLVDQPLGAFGAASDRGHPPLEGEPALGIELHHGAVAKRLDLLGSAQPDPLLCLEAAAGEGLARVEGHEYRVQRRCRRRSGALAGGGDGALADGFGVTGRHAQAMAGEGFAQRRPGRPQLLGGGIHAAEPLGKPVGAFGLGPVGQESAGLPAHSLLGMQRPHWSASARARPAFGGGLTAYFTACFTKAQRS